VRRRSDRGAGGALFQPEQLRALFRPARRAAGENRAERRDLGQPVRQRRQPRGHIETTGPEIWRQTDGKVDGFVCAVGTGGTLAGVGMALKARNKAVRIALADPMGAGALQLLHDRHAEIRRLLDHRRHRQGRITKNLEGAPIDAAYQIPDEEALPIIFDLLEHEGLCLGGSSGINVAGAVRLAKELGPGHTIVTILADYGTRYQSKLFNPAFLREKHLPVPAWLERRSSIKVPYE
jgi:cysteine synthase A